MATIMQWWWDRPNDETLPRFEDFAGVLAQWKNKQVANVQPGFARTALSKRPKNISSWPWITAVY